MNAKLSFTEQDIQALKTAITSLVQTVSYSDRSVTYRSLDDMIKLYDMVTRANSKRSKCIYPTVRSGTRRGEL